MSAFATDFAAAGFDLLADYHGESVTFTPKGGSARTITALVDRQAAERIPGTVNGFAPFVDVFLKYHATEGATAIVVGGDTVTLAPRVGGAAEPYPVGDVVAQGSGYWHLRIYVNG